MKTTTKEVKVFNKECPKCKQVISGYSEAQVNFALETHNRAKHKEVKQ